MLFFLFIFAVLFTGWNVAHLLDGDWQRGVVLGGGDGHGGMHAKVGFYFTFRFNYNVF